MRRRPAPTSCIPTAAITCTSATGGGWTSAPTSEAYRIGYAWSTDLADWNRDDAQVDLDVSPDGWDSEMVAYPAVFELDGRTYMLYAGNGNGKTGFGLAVLEGVAVMRWEKLGRIFDPTEHQLADGCSGCSPNRRRRSNSTITCGSISRRRSRASKVRRLPAVRRFQQGLQARSARPPLGTADRTRQAGRVRRTRHLSIQPRAARRGKSSPTPPAGRGAVPVSIDMNIVFGNEILSTIHLLETLKGTGRSSRLLHRFMGTFFIIREMLFCSRNWWNIPC